MTYQVDFVYYVPTVNHSLGFNPDFIFGTVVPLEIFS